MTRSAALVVIALVLALVASPLPAEEHSTAIDRDVLDFFGASEPLADAVCRTENYSFCNRVECCRGICLICTDIGGGFIEAEACEGTCWPRQI